MTYLINNKIIAFILARRLQTSKQIGNEQSA